jgi:hypothetical protein
VDDPVLFLSAARRYLTSGAELIVTVPAGPMSAFDRHIGHRQHFNSRKIEGILRAAGYSIEHIRATGFPFFNLYRLFVIAGGNQLKDVKTDARGVSSSVAAGLMTMFNLLFRGDIRDSRFGWQLVAVAHKTSS